jgi:hypothetical protein
LGGKGSAPQIREFVRKRFWPGLSEHWTAVLWEFAKDGRLGRDGINFTLAKAEAVETAVRKPAPPPRTMEARGEVALGEFEYGDKIVLLNAVQYRVAVKLKAAIGKGFLDFKFLSQAGLLKIAPDAEPWCRDMVLDLNPLLARVGLTVKYTPKFGCEMREVA